MLGKPPESDQVLIDLYHYRNKTRDGTQFLAAYTGDWQLLVKLVRAGYIEQTKPGRFRITLAGAAYITQKYLYL